MSNKVKQQAKQIAKNNRQIIEQSVSIERSGILPPPDDLEKYEAFYKGITKTLIDEFTTQADHRRQLESSVILSGIDNSKRGQIFAFILAFVVIVFGFVLLLLDKEVSGLALILGALATLLGVFIYGNSSKKNERIQKNQNVSE